jgi:hypothetical protein
MSDEDKRSYPAPATLRDRACGSKAHQRCRLALGKHWRSNKSFQKSGFMEVPLIYSKAKKIML